YRAVEDVVFGHKDGLALTFDVLTPEKDPKNIGVVLVSSGSWKSSKSDVQEENDRQRRGEHWVRGLLQGGYTLFVVRHGSGPRYPVTDMTPDIRRSVRFIRLHAADYGINPAKIGITSGSSGGHLALMTALTADDGNTEAKDPVERAGCRVQAVVAWFPPVDLINWGEPEGWKKLQTRGPKFFEDIFGKVTDLEAQLKSISPIYFASPSAPPLLLLHGDKDATVPLQQSELMKAKYEELGLPVKLVVHPGGGHSSWPGIMDDYPAVWEWFDRYLK
ncbi:alpha/beta hydrolase, partial [Candidatus Sumerlaeota bacterium]|nr:alpha/beta hydrolase [Candidatus Sumerlaeota bacterium]